MKMKMYDLDGLYGGGINYVLIAYVFCTIWKGRGSDGGATLAQTKGLGVG